MTIGEVIGLVPLERGMPGAQTLRWVQVRCGTKLVTALDPVGVRRGETVLVCAAARAGDFSPEVPTDAVIVGVVGENGNNG